MSNGAAAVLGCAKRIEDAERPSSSEQRLLIVARLVPTSALQGSAPLSHSPNPPAALSASAAAAFIAASGSASASVSDSASARVLARARFVRAYARVRTAVSDSGSGSASGSAWRCCSASCLPPWVLALARGARSCAGSFPALCVPWATSPRGALADGVKPRRLFATAALRLAILHAEGVGVLSGWGSGKGTPQGAKRPVAVTFPDLVRWCRSFGLSLDSLFSGSGRGAANSTGNRLGRESGSNKNGPGCLIPGPSLSSSCRLSVGTANPAPSGAFSSMRYCYVSASAN